VSEPRGDLRAAGLATVIGGGAFGAVAFVKGLPGPKGFVGLVLASGACVVLAMLMVRRRA
jgi:hypothetical protein